MFCPQCCVEYREGFIECSDCLVPLVSELPPEPGPEPDIVYVTILEAGNPAILVVAKSLLQGAGIEYFAIGEELQDIIGGGRLGFGFNPVTGPVCIKVRREDEDEARDLLRDLQEKGHA